MLSCQAIVGSQCNVIFTYEACVSDGSSWMHTISFKSVFVLALVIDGSVVDCVGVYLDVIDKF